ncbi:hypothetical protein GGR06_002678 [Bacteroides reticulotermitis]|nr:hypothetical protein [Bacteroides reticulotermitis]MBB4044880.1 hypothetical protein [Bacteroides reticulotermitis]
MITTTAEMLKKGYILFPKILFEEEMQTKKSASGDFDAFIIVLTHVNFSPLECCVRSHKFLCQRGESAMSVDRWAKLFGWGRSRTRYFFRKMIKNGFIEKIPNPYTTHIRILDYDLLVGKSRCQAQRNEAEGTTFEAFWEKFHETTQKPKVNIGFARREWKKLSANERRLSLIRIDDYYDNLTNTNFCLQASRYLSNKAFLDEYDY